MLCRALSRAAGLRMPVVGVRAISSTTCKSQADATGPKLHEIFENEKGSQRDLVNFPRRVRPIEISPVRHKWIPEEYFTFFYDKTGVTGPYIFGASFLTYLLSKEIWVIEHDFFAGGAVIFVLSMIAYKVGPSVSKMAEGLVTEKENSLKAIRQDEIDSRQNAISEENNAQWMATSYEPLIEAKKECAAMQLEVEYRQRISEAFIQVKKRLDFQLALANVTRTAEQKHMVDWIITNVKKSITPKQEEDALKKCVADLKMLAN